MIVQIPHSDRYIQWEISNRHDGDMRDESNVRSFLKKKSFPDNDFVLAQQVHDTEVKIVNVTWRKRSVVGVDGLITNDNIALCIRAADCIPLLLYDASKGIVAAGHSGWKGTYSNIARELISEMLVLEASVDSIEAVLGPHIRSCCYTVDAQRGNNFLQRYGSESVSQEGQVYSLHLDIVVRDQLLDEGVLAQNIAISTQCTSSLSETYFSYRRDSLTTFGEQISFIGIKQVKSETYV